MEIRNSIEGEYLIQIIREDGSIKESLDFKNLITNNGMNNMFTMTNTSQFNECKVGTGTTVPTFSDSSLTSPHVVTTTKILNATYTGISVSPAIVQMKIGFQFALGLITQPITEIGIGSSAFLFSKALITDFNGNPTTINVLSNESLQVYYTLKMNIDTNDKIYQFTLSDGITYTATLRPAIVNSATYWLNPNGYSYSINTVYAKNIDFVGTSDVQIATGSAPTNSLYSTYVTNNFYVDYSYRWSSSTANYTEGIKSLLIYVGTTSGGLGCYQVSFSPAIPRSGLTSFKFSFRNSLTRG
jgi:hypothetical protein